MDWVRNNELRYTSADEKAIALSEIGEAVPVTS